MRGRTAWLLLRSAVSILALAVLLSRVNLVAALHLAARLDMGVVLLGLAIGVGGVILSAAQWGILLRTERIELNLPVLSGLYFLGMTFNQLLPTIIGGDVAKAIYVGRLSGRGVGAAGATIMARAVGFAVLLLTALPAAIVTALTFPRYGWGAVGLIALLILGYGGCLVMLLFSPALLRRLWPNRLRLSGIWPKGLALAESVSAYHRRLPAVGKALLVSLAFYAALNLSIYCYGVALHLALPLWFYWLAVPLMSIATMLPVALNGYGVREASLVLIFGAAGVAAPHALSLALVIDAQFLLFALVGAGYLLFSGGTPKPGLATARIGKDELAVDR